METEKINAVETPVTAPVVVETYRHNHRPMFLGGVIIAFVLVLALGLFAGHMAMRHNLAQRVGSRIELKQGMMNGQDVVSDRGQFNANGSGFGGGQRPMMGGANGGFGSHRFGGQNGKSGLMGVVTASDSTGFTVAWNGSTTRVNTDSSTTVTGDTVAVNDTVRVVGTETNGTWTATKVLVNQ